MKISTSSDMYRHLSLAEACREIKKAGCAGVDVWSSPRMCEHVLPTSSAAEVRRMLSDNGLATAALTAYHTLSPSESIERFTWSIEFAAEIGAPCVVTNGADWKADRTSYLKHLAPALKVARERKVRIAFENHSGQHFSGTREDLLGVAQEMTDPWFGFNIAPAHLTVRGSDVVETIRNLGPRIFFFYAWDHVPGVDDNGKQFVWPPPYPEHQFPGGGKLDFGAYLRTLRKVGYDGWLNIRSYPGYCPTPWPTDRITTEIKRAVEHLTSLQKGT